MVLARNDIGNPVAYEAVVATAVVLMAEGHRGGAKALRKKHASCMAQLGSKADARAKQITEAIFQAAGIRATVYAAEGFGRDGVRESFRAAEVIHPQGMAGAVRVISDVIEGTNALIRDNDGVPRDKLSRAESGATSAMAVGEGLRGLGIVPDSYADTLCTRVPSHKVPEIQIQITDSLGAEDERTIEHLLGCIADANGLQLGDLEVVLMRRPREAARVHALQTVRARHPGLCVTEISDGTVAHGLDAVFHSKRPAGKHKILWTVGAAPEGAMNLAVASAMPGGVAAYRIYSKTMNKDPQGKPVGDHSMRLQWSRDETEMLEAREDGQVILAGGKVFTPRDIVGGIEGFFSFITDNGVFDVPGVAEVAPGVYRVHTLCISKGQARVIAEEIPYARLLGALGDAGAGSESRDAA